MSKIVNVKGVICIDRMQEAYGLLYKLENSLRNYIDHQMTLYYGTNWQMTAPKNMPFRRYPLYQSYFYHLENYIHAFPCFEYPDELINNLRKLYPIRNKIAHCHELSAEEYQILNDCFDKIMNLLIGRL